jgi:signal transduction histidine kinase
LETALRNLCNNIADQHHIVVEFVSDDVKGLPADVNLCLFRVAQEALSNAVRHGKAKRIEVLLQKDKHLLTLNVSDEGEGFDPAIAPGGLGLLSMLERVRFIGGNVLVRSQVGRGTQVEAELPLRKSA